MGVNTVDCSPELIERNWARIRVEHAATPPPDPEITGPGAEDGVIETKAEIKQATIDGLKTVINKGLNALLNRAFKLGVDVALFEDFTEAAATLIHKRQPNLSALEIIQKYWEEIAFAWATIMLVVGITQAVRAKRKPEISEPKPEAEAVTHG